MTQPIRLAFVGDIAFPLGRNVVVEEDVREVLHSAHSVVGNLECVLSRSANFQRDHYSKLNGFDGRRWLATRQEFAFRVPAIGVSAVCLANNHILDYGVKGLEDTIEALESAGVPHFGAGLCLRDAIRPLIIEDSGQRIGILGFSYTYEAGRNSAGAAPIRLSLLRKTVAELAEQVDNVVVVLHWGREFSTRPASAQRQIVSKLAEWGADVVVGHHPHVVQDVESSPIPAAYSLGGYVFDPSYLNVEDRGLAELCNIGGILVVSFSATGAPTAELVPIGLNVQGNTLTLRRAPRLPESAPFIAPARPYGLASAGLNIALRSIHPRRIRNYLLLFQRVFR